jgi:predicted amidohydrolase
MILDPWGEVMAELDGECKEGLIFADIDLARLRQVRQEMPVFSHIRSDLY